MKWSTRIKLSLCLPRPHLSSSVWLQKPMDGSDPIGTTHPHLVDNTPDVACRQFRLPGFPPGFLKPEADLGGSRKCSRLFGTSTNRGRERLHRASSSLSSLSGQCSMLNTSPQRLCPLHHIGHRCTLCHIPLFLSSSSS